MQKYAAEAVKKLPEEDLLPLTPDQITNISKSEATNIITQHYAQDDTNTSSTPTDEDIRNETTMQRYILENEYAMAQLNLRPIIWMKR